MAVNTVVPSGVDGVEPLEKKKKSKSRTNSSSSEQRNRRRQRRASMSAASTTCSKDEVDVEPQHENLTHHSDHKSRRHHHRSRARRSRRASMSGPSVFSVPDESTESFTPEYCSSDDGEDFPISSSPRCQQQEQRGRTRRVSISEHQNITYENTQSPSSYKKKSALWYTKQEIKQMRQDKKDAYKSINADAAEDVYKEALLQVYGICMAGDGNSKLPKDTRKQVKRVLRQQVDRIGLERFCVPDVAESRYERRRSLVQQIVELHNDLGQNSPLTPLERAEILRESCESLTLASRLFAQHMASSIMVKHSSSSGTGSGTKQKRRASCAT